jgi:hypothetical protein
VTTILRITWILPNIWLSTSITCSEELIGNMQQHMKVIRFLNH